MKQAVVYWKTLKAGILTLTDRKTDSAIIQHLPCGRKANPIAKAVIKQLAYLKRRGLLHSITTDNGSEFMVFGKIEKTFKIPVFFARPYPSTDKPHIEHLNALIRQYIPKAPFSPIFPLTSLPIRNQTKQ